MHVCLTVFLILLPALLKVMFETLQCCDTESQEKRTFVIRIRIIVPSILNSFKIVVIYVSKSEFFDVFISRSEFSDRFCGVLTTMSSSGCRISVSCGSITLNCRQVSILKKSQIAIGALGASGKCPLWSLPPL